MFQTFIGLIALAALLSFLNKKVLKLPDTIGVMILAIVLSLVFALSSLFQDEATASVCMMVEGVDFKSFVLEFLLGFLLFAGSIHVNTKELLKAKGPILIYATLGVVVSTVLVGTAFFYVVGLFGIEISYYYCLVFGALISPTDPIAVLALLQQAGVSKDLEIKIVGESLFNDGVGIVVFLTLLSLATSQHAGIDPILIGEEFLREVGGGVALGLALAWVGKKLLLSLGKAPVIATHVTLAMVMGGYSLAMLLHVSGALAMVVAGLYLGSVIHDKNFCELEREHINVFWKIIDEILNSVLFVLIGIEMIAVHFHLSYFMIGLSSIVIVLGARYIAVLQSNIWLKAQNRMGLKSINVLTWAGLRGGISIALALSLPEGEVRDVILMATYTVVVFSIIVQGLSIGNVVKAMRITS